MKSKDFIKMIQEEDPTGEYHVRLPGGMPVYCQLIPGYYDGPYSYIDDEGCLCISEKDSKLDIQCEDLDDFIWSQHGKTDNIKLDLEDKKGIQETIDKTSWECKKCEIQLLHESVFQVLNNIKTENFCIIQPARIKIGVYNYMWYIRDPKRFIDVDKNGLHLTNHNQKKLNQGECSAVLISGFFTPRTVSGRCSIPGNWLFQQHDDRGERM